MIHYKIPEGIGVVSLDVFQPSLEEFFMILRNLIDQKLKELGVTFQPSLEEFFMILRS